MSKSGAKPEPRDPVTAWAKKVTEGKVLAGDLVRCAAERHLRDLRDGPARGLHWDLKAAKHAIAWFPALLTITGGAKAGLPFDLIPYTVFLTGQTFGWKRTDGLRRFRTVWVETGKGQAKSPWMAALGIYGMRFLGVPRAEIYAIAGTKDQANVLFRDAVAMARAPVPGLEESLAEHCELIIRGTGDNAWKIEWDGNDEGLGSCLFRPIATGDAISGPKPLMVLGDEIHELKEDRAIELWSAALAKMPGDPLMVLGTNTPAADQIVGTTYSDYYTRVAKGEFEDDSSLAFIAAVDKDDDPLKDETCWGKALPALGITYEPEKIRDEVAKCQGLPSKALKVKRLFFGIRVGAAESWIDQGAWEAVQGIVDEDDMRELPCWMGLDLSARKDLTALAQVWRAADGRLFAKVRYWTPLETLSERVREDKAPYDIWVEQGFLNGVPGPVIDKGFVAREVKNIVAEHDVQALAFDAAQIIDFETAATDIGLPIWRFEGPDAPKGEGLMMIRHSQGFRGMDSTKALWMPRSVVQTEDVVLQKGIIIDESPVTRFCSANMSLAMDNAGNRAPTRRRSRGRIDGIVALMMAAGAATAGNGDSSSIYEDRGLLVF